MEQLVRFLCSAAIFYGENIITYSDSQIKIHSNQRNIYETQYWNYGNSLSFNFGKNFVKVTVLLNNLLRSWFDERFFCWERISSFSTLWITYIITESHIGKFVKSIYSKYDCSCYDGDFGKNLQITT